MKMMVTAVALCLDFVNFIQMQHSKNTVNLVSPNEQASSYLSCSRMEIPVTETMRS